ncbi:MAG: hypothetical protein HXY40_12000 [Chloroflexi bacterium]|nr:hypothetical protein [Chloroflexota bacterium]
MATWNWRTLLTVVVFLAGTLFMILTLRYAWTEFWAGQNLGGFLVIFVMVCFFPLTYMAYYGQQRQTRIERLRDDLALLGYTQSEAQAKANELYQRVHDPLSYTFFIALACLLTIIGGSWFFWDPQTSPVLALKDTNTLQAMRYGFLGAYLFSVFLIYRRYTTNDLHPMAYLYAAFTLLAGMVFNYVAFETIAFVANSEGTQQATGIGAGLLAIIAFSLGFFPYLAVRWFNRLAQRALEFSGRRTESLHLGLIDGISDLHETRLRDNGIDDIQNLASAEIIDLLVNTAFSAQQVLEWIDQAILFLYLDESEIESFRRGKIRLLSDFHKAWESCAEDGAKQQELARQLQSTPDKLGTLYRSTREGANVHRVLDYWDQATARIQDVRKFSEKQMKELFDLLRSKVDSTWRTGTPPEENLDTLISLAQGYGKLLEQLNQRRGAQPDAQILAQLGGLSLWLGAYGEAIERLNTAIELDHKQMADTEKKGGALAELKHICAEHHMKRAYAYVGLERYAEAQLDLDETVKLTPDDPYVYANRAYAYRAQKKFNLVEAELSTMTKRFPEQPDGYNELALFYLGRDEKLDEALVLSNQAVEKSTASHGQPRAMYLDTLAAIQTKLGFRQQNSDERQATLKAAYTNILQAFNDADRTISDYGFREMTNTLVTLVEAWLEERHAPGVHEILRTVKDDLSAIRYNTYVPQQFRDYIQSLIDKISDAMNTAEISAVSVAVPNGSGPQ